MSVRILIADSSPLIALADAGHLGILPALGMQVHIPQAVADEAGATGRRPALTGAAWLTICPTPAPRPELADLDVGEAAAIALALIQRPDAVVIDERRGSRQAVALGLPVLGTLGLLIRARRAGIIPALRPVAQDVRRAGLWLSDAVIDAACQTVGE